ncbi:hypothetical protein HK101_000184 [Irineochytrium annulatum]|nr:hypothetical protein HK101_000184 [Irineochytrium annulatum]
MKINVHEQLEPSSALPHPTLAVRLSMGIKVYGTPFSTCTGRVLVTLREKNVPFELVPIDMAKGEHKAASYLALQPFGQVPVLDDDGLILFESRAICRYIATKYRDQGPDLLADKADVKTRAMVDVWSSVEAFDYDPHLSKLVGELLFKKMRGGTPDLEVAKGHRENWNKTLDIYEKHLAKNQYLAGDVFTLADLYHLTYTNYAFAIGHGDAITTRPNVKAWWERISARPAWVATKPASK